MAAGNFVPQTPTLTAELEPNLQLTHLYLRTEGALSSFVR